ncbi:hypothetical protein EXE58_00585 [Nocardioides seonyuensis]|uniref:Uncharacterized protein n=1 Tax=Nocardioides seonyuensis TaxID=2518371 RepID=A0A4P7IAT7_9ACTN|nr:hypothetical protein [Nocardioides seonyuensis]QBX54115.1 hypothetical protein EXE58_00585 [Nocardioides seonyuensis]
MGLWDAMRGRSRPTRNNLDSLFLVPSAAITLQTAAGLEPTGLGAVCYRAAAGAAFAQTQDDVVTLIRDDPDAPEVSLSTDPFGFTWLVVDDDPHDLTGLCTDLHAVNTSLEAQGFQAGLLCSVVPFASSTGQKVGLVYLYKQGTFYPFAPTGPQARDNLLELSVRDHLAAELPMEQDLSRWLALWGAPGL